MKYLIELKPLGSYFFGGEVTFGEAGTAQNYLVKSNVMPQASAVLGLMRYCILRWKGLLSYSQDDVKLVTRLIGPKGFDFGADADYGIIKSVSPVFITDGNDFYTPMPLDKMIRVERNEADGKVSYTPKILDNGMKVEFNGKNRCSFSDSASNDSLPVINGYDSKKYDTYKYWYGTNGIKSTEDLFTFSNQIVITKNGRKKNEKDAFFKQTTVLLNPRMSFAFTVELKDNNFLSDKEIMDIISKRHIVPFGGNRSMFLMTVKNSVDWNEKFSALHEDNRLLLLGDAVLENDLRNKCRFIWGESKPFRYMINVAKDRHSLGEPKKKEKLLHLQSRGSVIYADPDTLNRIRNNAKTSLTDIGLNIFI